jgi:hypothetical protein
MLNNRVLLFISGILLLANLSMFAFFLTKKESSKGESRSEKRRSPVGLFLEKDLHFSPEQLKQFDTLRQLQRPKIRTIAEELQKAKVRFYALLGNDTTSQRQLDSASSKIGELQKALDLQAFQNFRELRALCNAEQRPRYDSMIPGLIENMWFPSRKGSGHPRESSHHAKH